MADLNVNSIGDASGGNTATINSYTPTESNMAGRNRIINGDMRIDQRNAGASVTPASGEVTYTVDRWKYFVTQASKLTVQQNAGAVTPPSGFSNYLGTTSSSAYSVVSGDLFIQYQAIEGFNCADFAWGTSSAAAITISFWVRSSLTGTHSGAVQNSANNRSYAFTFTVSSANTWEQKTVTIAGDTSGVWLTNNGVGLSLYFNLGAGSIYSTTAGSWQAGNFGAVTGAVSVVGTSGATFYVTGVQLEAGSVATPFERRQYGQELALCQRYYYKWVSTATNESICTGFAYASIAAFVIIPFPVTMRARPAALETTGTSSNYRFLRAGAVTINCSSGPIYSNSSTQNGQMLVYVASGLATGEGLIMQSNATGAFLAWSAEL